MGVDAVVSPLQGTVVTVDVAAGDQVGADTVVAVVESMKMEHPVVAGIAGVIESIDVATGDLVHAGDVLVQVTEGAGPSVEAPVPTAAASEIATAQRADLGEVIERQRLATRET